VPGTKTLRWPDISPFKNFGRLIIISLKMLSCNLV
jgi:hypothetical protein